MFSLDNQKWEGLNPIPYSQNPKEPFSIEHGGDYGNAMELFRAVMNQSELSPRALEITTFLISVSPSNPYLYWYREKILDKLGFDFNNELEFSSKLALNFLKPYQIWRHRQWIMERAPQSSSIDETKFVQDVLQNDGKNFHVWEYIYWYAGKFDKWQWLLDQTTVQLNIDPKNNSAWSMRYSSITHIHMKPSDDIQFALEKFKECPSSQSCASYIKGLLDIDISLANEVKNMLTSVLSQNNNYVPALNLSAQIAEMEGNIEEYDRIIDQIAAVDTMRTHFWHLMKSNSSRFT
ncbi:CAAX geranylgeranyltransferase alpha subunit [Tritrichomonas musculus]|uniref:Protein farnesyltransferase/geranylgeranyltransferase type-1 subunit alpha n=1 Tax=Tritrichomonas musculus TaxID=1915356 RepID=A0ABR2KSB7_9EUKA